LRALELSNTTSTPMLGAIGPVLDGALPQLERLKLFGAAELADVRHPTLTELEIGSTDAAAHAPATPRAEPRTLVDRIAGLDRANLPALARLVVHAPSGLDAALFALVRTNVLANLHTLALRGDLRHAIDDIISCGTRFEVIDVRGSALSDAERRRLSA